MSKSLMILIAGLAVILFAAANAAGQDSAMDIHGFISQGYFSSTENYFTDEGSGDDFIFNEVGINFSQELTDELRVGFQLFSRDFKDAGSNEIKVDWAVADYRIYDWLGLRFGQMKMPHGLYNEIRDIDMLRNPVFLPESVYQELSHDLYMNDVFFGLGGINSRDLFLSLQGIGLYGFLDLNLLGGLSYQVLYGTQEIESQGARDFEKVDESLFSILENARMQVDYKYASNVLWETPLEGLRFGFSMNNTNMDVLANLNLAGLPEPLSNLTTLPTVGDDGAEVSVEYEKLENYVASVEFTWDNLLLTAEYLFANNEIEIKVPEQSKTIESNPTGWYAGAAYRLFDWLELGGYYSKSDGDNDGFYENNPVLPHPGFFYEFEDIAATARFDINQYWTLKLEAHNITGRYSKGRVNDMDNIANGEDFLLYKDVEEDWNLYVAKMTVAF